MVREIEIDGSLYPDAGFYRRWLATEYPEGGPPHTKRKIIALADVLAQLEAARRDGAGAILLAVDSLGGNNRCALELHHALRAFPGRVVAYVRRAWSAWPAVIQAADAIVIDPAGSFGFHGTIPTRSAPDTQAANETWIRMVKERTGLDLAPLYDDWREVSELHSERAVHWRLADVVGSLEYARALAAALAAGGSPPASERRLRLVEVDPMHSADAPDGRVQVTDHEARVRELAAGTWRQVSDIHPTASFNILASNGARVAALSYSTGGVCVTSDDHGETWSSRTMPNGPWRDAIYSPTLGLWIAVGTNLCNTSPDANTWTARSMPPGTWNALVDTGSRVVAVGVNAFAYTTDGVNWTTVPGPAGTWLDVEWTGQVVVAIGYDILATSPDGASAYTSRSAPSGNWHCMAVGSGTILAIGNNGWGVAQVATAGPDGIAWTVQPSPASSGWYEASGSLRYDGRIFCFVTNGGWVCTTRDGIAWRSVRPAVLTDNNSQLVWTGRRFIICGPSRVAWVSLSP